jgi:very-short-patch-repair endonuclease
MPHERRNRNSLFRDRSRELRADQNLVEAILWQKLRNGKLKGFKFRRQHPVGRYILDFYCAAASLAIELDGITHQGRDVYDSMRQAWLESQGLMVIRCPNHDFLTGIESLLELVWRRCCERTGRLDEST